MVKQNECKLVLINENHCQIILSTDENPYLSMDKVVSLKALATQVNSLEKLKIVEFTGSSKYFSAGGDVSFLSNLEPNNSPSMLANIPELILDFKPITIANMYGHALGGGLALGLWSDLPCLCESSLYGSNFTKLGFTPGMGSTIILEEYFGKPLAYEMLLTGKLYKGKNLKGYNCPISYRIYSHEDYGRKLSDLISALMEIEVKPLMLLKNTLAQRRRKMLIQSSNDEIDMHEICFSDELILKSIADKYSGNLN